MKVVTDQGETIELGDVETTPTIGITDFSRRVTDDFGVTTVVERPFSRRMSVKLALPFDNVSAVQQKLAGLRATSALWIADDRFAWLSARGFYKDFDIDHASPPLSYCTLNVEGLAETATATDTGIDPAATGTSSLLLLQPATIVAANLVSSNVPENDAAEWSAQTTYPLGARVIKASTHRVYESAIAGNVGSDPAGTAGKWIDVGPTKRWAMFDQALGTSTTEASSVVVTIDAPAIHAVALLDVIAAGVRVQAAGYDRTIAPGAGAITFLDLPASITRVTVTTTGDSVTIGTLLVGKLVGLGVTEASPTAGITDFSRKDVDDFGAVTIVERAWSKRMTAKALIRTDAVDVVANRIATVRAQPSLWIGQTGLDSLIVYGFFKDFSIEVGESVSKVSLTIEGLSKAAPAVRPPVVLVPRGNYGATVSYAEGDIVQYEGSSWQYINVLSGSGNAPPSLPATENAYWRVFAAAGTDGSSGGDGRNGTDGAPGAPGADGKTSYVHYAYANSPDGVIDFTTDQPNGRAYEGSYTDFSAADSGNPAVYSWREYKGPPFGMASRGAAVVAGNSVIKPPTAAAGWDSDAYSTVGYRNGCIVSFSGTGNTNIMAGLNSDPTSDSSYTSLDYAWYLRDDGATEIYENGVSVFGPAYQGYGTGTFQVDYDGKQVVYTYNGLVARTVPAPANMLFYFDSSIFSPNGRLNTVTFAARGAAGRNGLDGSNGAPGAPGANGQTTFVHYAYADSADGAVNFTTDVPGNRAFVGIYTDFTAADSTNPLSYVWAQYVGPSGFGLAGSGDVVVSGAKLVKRSSGGWGTGGGYSTEGWKNGAQAVWTSQAPPADIMAGLNTDPAANDSYETIDYAWYMANDGGCDIYEGGGYCGRFGTFGDGTRFQVAYDGRLVRYYLDGVLKREVAATAGLTLYFDAAIAGGTGSEIRAISFGASGTAGTDGAPGVRGDDGLPGAPGANGVSSYTAYAYANSPDGTLDFTTGEPGNRGFIGVSANLSSATEPTSPAAYTWSLYRGPVFGIGTRGGAVVIGNTVLKSYASPGVGTGWDADAFSTSSYTGAASVSFILTGNTQIMAGLNTDPLTDASYGSIDFAFYRDANDNLLAFENSAVAANFGGPFDDATRLRIDYDGERVTYFIGDAPRRQVRVGPGVSYYFDSSIVSDGRVQDLSFSGGGRTTASVNLVADTPSTFVSANEIRGMPPESGWGSVHAHSIESFTRGAVAQWTIPASSGGQNAMVGLGQAQHNGDSFEGITFSIFQQSDGYVDARVNGNGIIAGPVVNTAVDNNYKLHFDGETVRYFANGVQFGTFAWGRQPDPLYFVAAMASSNPRVTNITFTAAGTVGADGRDGLNGNNGAPGAPGANGQTSYLHIAYANSANGYADFTTGAPGGRSYLGTLVDQTLADSGDPAAYRWSLVKGADGLNGANGSPGAPGANGQPTYVHIAYSNSADGQNNFSVDDPTGRTYVGFYIDQIVADSGNPAVYSWSLVKGADGSPGSPGAPGPQGPPGAAGVSAPPAIVVTGSGSAMAPVLLTPGKTLSVESNVGFTSNQAGTVTLQIQAAYGAGGYNVIGSNGTYVGPGEPGSPYATGSVSNTGNTNIFVTIRVIYSGPSGLTLNQGPANYLRAY